MISQGRRLRDAYPGSFCACRRRPTAPEWKTVGTGLSRRRSRFDTALPAARAAAGVLHELGIAAKMLRQMTNRSFSNPRHVDLLSRWRLDESMPNAGGDTGRFIRRAPSRLRMGACSLNSGVIRGYRTRGWHTAALVVPRASGGAPDSSSSPYTAGLAILRDTAGTRALTGNAGPGSISPSLRRQSRLGASPRTNHFKRISFLTAVTPATPRATCTAFAMSARELTNPLS